MYILLRSRLFFFEAHYIKHLSKRKYTDAKRSCYKNAALTIKANLSFIYTYIYSFSLIKNFKETISLRLKRIEHALITNLAPRYNKYFCASCSIIWEFSTV